MTKKMTKGYETPSTFKVDISSEGVLCFSAEHENDDQNGSYQEVDFIW